MDSKIIYHITVYIRKVKLKNTGNSPKLLGGVARPLSYWMGGEISGARSQVGRQGVPKFDNSISHISVSSARTLAVPRCNFVHFWTDFFYKNPQNSILTPFWGMQPHTYFNSKLKKQNLNLYKNLKSSTLHLIPIK